MGIAANKDRCDSDELLQLPSIPSFSAPAMRDVPFLEFWRSNPKHA